MTYSQPARTGARRPRSTVYDAAQGQSVVAVRAGEQLSERQLLEALLIPSGNNIARMLAARVAGSETRFLAEMNVEARGAATPVVYAHAKHWATIIPTEAWAGGIAASVIIGAVGGLIPALRAARLSPTQALWSV